MPHTNRKKKSTAGSTPTQKTPLTQHTKRTAIEDAEGWTHIIDTPRARSSTLKKAANISTLHGGDFEIDGVSYINRTLEELKQDYQFWRKGWEESPACVELKTVVEKKGEEYRKVDNVVVLGLGSLQSSRREGRRASATQLAALQTIIGIMGAEMPVMLQDPQFTELDKEFLTSLGYTVVADPEAFGCVKEGSLVYAIHCYAKVYKAVSEGVRPAVLVGTDVGNFGRFDTSDAIDDVAKSLEGLVDGCEALDFPQIRHDFSDTKIYWRKTEQTIEAGEKVDETKVVDEPEVKHETAEEKPEDKTAHDQEALPKSDDESSLNPNAASFKPSAKTEPDSAILSDPKELKEHNNMDNPTMCPNTIESVNNIKEPDSAQPFQPPTRSLHFSDQFVISCGTVTLDPSTHKILIILWRSTGEYLLPKGRKDVGESLSSTAIRETFEETGYECELLPHTFGTLAQGGLEGEKTTEPFAMQQRPSAGKCKIIFWYLAKGDSTAVKREGTQMVDEDFESLWVGGEELLGVLTWEDDRAVAARAMEYWK